MANSTWARELAALAPLREKEPLSRHTTFGIGGPADLYAVAESVEQLERLVKWARSRDVPIFILGSGSNILVGDGGIRGLVIENRLTAMGEPSPQPDGSLLMEAQSGASLASLARRLARAGVAGLEWACGIPGTLGGSVVYNAGAYGGCLADVLQSIRALDANGEEVISADRLALGYRGSAFTRGILSDRIVLSLSLKLHLGQPDELWQRVQELDHRRTSAQPPGRNAGSIFRNPPEHPAWWLIDQVGLRGHRIGDAEISTRHANFIVNVGRATAAQVKALIDLVQRRVWEEFGITLEPEVALVGEGF